MKEPVEWEVREPLLGRSGKNRDLSLLLVLALINLLIILSNQLLLAG